MSPASLDPLTVEEIFKDFTARRAGIVRALTTDVDTFYGLCDPDKAKEGLCLYGHPNESWEVKPLDEEASPRLPEPVCGINFTRDEQSTSEWLLQVALHSDCWLRSLALYFCIHFHRDDRRRLCSLFEDLPTIFEVVSEWKHMDKPSVESGSETGGNTKAFEKHLVKIPHVHVYEDLPLSTEIQAGMSSPLPSPNCGDLTWPPKLKFRGRSTKGKRIGSRNLLRVANSIRFINTCRCGSMDSGSFLPGIPNISCDPTGRTDEERSRICALAALATLNDEEINQGPTYELVKPLGCMPLQYVGTYHCNFIARPVSGSEADDKLCFAELEVDFPKELEELRAVEYHAKEATLTSSKCRFANILGPPGFKTGLYGCRSCGRGRIQHPKGVPFKKR